MSDGWGEFLLAFGVFLASHVLPARPGVKDRIVAMTGRAAYAAIYSTVSLVILAWLIVAAGRAPFVPLWDMQGWHRWVVNLAMPAAILLAACAVGAPNPLSFGGRADGFDPDRPGVAGVARHPALWVLLIWAGAHLLVNGDLAHVILFGVFAGFSILGMWALDKRHQRRLGADWSRLAARTSALPFAALIEGRWRPAGPLPVVRLGIGGAVWLLLLWLHLPVIGVPPLP